jgi:carbon-monoxide dehydrogenase large subunit
MAGGGCIIPGLYDIENFYLSVAAVFTNTVPTETYRGAGRPETNFLMERLMDNASDVCGLPRKEVRRRNFIPAHKLPYKTPLGLMIDSGDFRGTLQQALVAADWEGLESRRSVALSRGHLRGMVFGMFIAGAGGPPMEEIRLRVAPNGRVALFPGTYSHGQGHETVYAQLASRFLGVPFEAVELVQGDTDTMPDPAVGTFGSRSSMMGGVAVKRVCTQTLEKARHIAAHLLQTDGTSVTFAGGRFTAAAGSITLAQVAAAAGDPNRLPEGLEPGLDACYTLH